MTLETVENIVKNYYHKNDCEIYTRPKKRRLGGYSCAVVIVEFDIFLNCYEIFYHASAVNLIGGIICYQIKKTDGKVGRKKYPRRLDINFDDYVI